MSDLEPEVNGCGYGTFATGGVTKSNVAGKLQELLKSRGVERDLLTAWCGAHKNSLVWQGAWDAVEVLKTLEAVLAKVSRDGLSRQPMEG